MQSQIQVSLRDIGTKPTRHIRWADEFWLTMCSLSASHQAIERIDSSIHSWCVGLLHVGLESDRITLARIGTYQGDHVDGLKQHLMTDLDRLFVWRSFGGLPHGRVFDADFCTPSPETRKQHVYSANTEIETVWPKWPSNIEAQQLWGLHTIHARCPTYGIIAASPSQALVMHVVTNVNVNGRPCIQSSPSQRPNMHLTQRRPPTCTCSHTKMTHRTHQIR